MPRFVIQQHEKQGEKIHWDLMLEQGDVLKTFRLDKPPEDIGLHAAQAVLIFDHSLKFLTYEGPVNQGLGRVHIVEQGTFKTLSQDNYHWSLQINGHILNGNFSLWQLDNKWSLTLLDK